MCMSPSAELGRPAALSRQRLASVPGVLGQIATERAADYAAFELLIEAARPVRPAFAQALRRTGTPTGDQTPLAVIAEVKRASPSQGAIAALDPVAAAQAYAAGGAGALSVLTETRHFGGDLEHLRDIAASRPSLPLLRKDFT